MGLVMKVLTNHRVYLFRFLIFIRENLFKLEERLIS